MIATLKDRYIGCMPGLAVGDALGAQVEFMERDSFPTVTEMVGGGVHRLKAGEWTDDTSMALCLAVSLLACEGFNVADQMQRYCDWYKHGYMSSNGECFDIGNQTREALERYLRTGKTALAAPEAAGNGCIMRLAPVTLYFFPDYGAMNHYSMQSAVLTHNNLQCLATTGQLSMLIAQMLDATKKPNISFDHHRSEVKSTGFVVDTLDAARWAFRATDTFEHAIIAAVNLGGDADTIGAVTGQLAGAYYGASAIPARWLDKLAHRDMIIDLAVGLYEKKLPERYKQI